MGLLIEYNWYLVISDIKEIKVYENSSYKYIIKSGNRVYPINMPIPLIVKNYGCISMVEIKEINNTINNVIVIFDDKIPVTIDESIKNHYYTLYKSMKCKD